MSSAIDYRQLRSLTARELVRALLRDRFVLVHQKGSHHRFRHPDGRRVSVALHHPGDTYPVKTLKTIIEEQARWTVADLKRLGLIK